RVDNDYRQSQWGDWYMFGNDGRIATQVYQWAGTYYYFDPLTYLRVDNDYRQSQWGDWYMFGNDGRIISGFYNWQGSLYFFDPSTYLRLTNAYFNGNGYWNDWSAHWADYNGIVHSVTYFSQFRPVWAGWGCAGAALTMLLSIHNIWPGVGNVISGIPQGGNGGQIGNPYSGAGFSRVIQPGALAAYGRRWYGGVSDSTGATIAQIANAVLSGHPVIYYGYSPYDAGGARNHCKVIYGYNRNNGLFHVYDPCYGNGGWGAYSEGRTAYDRGYNAWISWGQLASEYAGQAVSIY
ncbi:C39 family peptidase, partial [Limosilactobacillus reuteri]|uniref:C39 family peptidase n=1 Tax=Limosilactobacillus reuteri TaxID=1598 RepID=UPI001E64BE19